MAPKKDMCPPKTLKERKSFQTYEVSIRDFQLRRDYLLANQLS